MATINDIAKMAGVSTSTVSHVVNKTRYVSPELVKRVEKAIEELEVPPNFVIKKGKRAPIAAPAQTSEKYILLLITEKKSNFQKQIEHQIESHLKDSGYSLLTVLCSSQVDSLAAFLRSVIESRLISGIILFPDERDYITNQILSGQSVPVVILGRETEGYLADTITSDTREGAYRAIEHLIKNGHEQIAYIGRSIDRSPKRLEGYRSALNDYSIAVKESYVHPQVQSETEAYEVLDSLLFNEQPAPTALFVANYSLVTPVFRYIRLHNIPCPESLSIVTFNDFEWSALHTPAITTISQNTEEFGRLAVEMLLQRIRNNEAANVPALKEIYIHRSLSTKINVRESTCGIGRGPFGERAASPSSLSLNDSEIAQIRSRHLTAAISFHYAGKAWMELHQKGIRDVFDNLGISLIAITDAHFDPSLQCRQLDSLRLLEPDIIIAIPTDNRETSEAFQRIVSGSSRLVLISNVPEGLTVSDYVSCVSVNEHSHGRNMGHGLGEYMLRHSLTKAALITHDADFYATNQRDNAAIQVLTEEYPSIQICANIQFHRETEVYENTLKYIKHHPEIEALYVSWDGPALEAIRALSELDRTDIAIVTGDLDYPDALNMAKGEMIKMISAQCSYEQGQAIALAAANAMLGKKTPSFIGIEPISVTPANLLKSWSQIFKEEPPSELKQAFKKSANDIAAESEEPLV